MKVAKLKGSDENFLEITGGKINPYLYTLFIPIFIYSQVQCRHY